MHSAVRELSRVAIPETEAAWLEAAHGKSLREVEAMVSGHRPGNLPTDETEPRLHRRTITLELSPETYDLWRKLHAVAAEEHGQRLSDDELIQSLFRRAYGDGPSSGRTSTATTPGAAGAAAAGAAAAGAAAAAGTAAAASGAAAAASGTAAAAGTAAAVSGTAAAAAEAAAAAAGAAAAAAEAAAAAAGDAPAGGGTGRGLVGAQGAGLRDAGDAPAGGGTGGSPAYKIALKQCPDCKRGWQYSGGRDIEVDPAVLECAACDAVHLGSLDAAVPERATTTVTPRKREQVLARDGHCCTVPGCRRNVGLDLHHIEYQSHGGSHSLANLTTLCDLHHRAVHFEKLVIRGAAPDRLTFEFRRPRDRRNVTDDDPPQRHR